MHFHSLYMMFTLVTEYFQSAVLLILRLIIAYGFYEPAMSKINDIDSVAGWFGSMGIPFPTVNAYMAAGTEILGVGLLVLGLFTRLISLPLIVIMIVAIFTVHLDNGFSAGTNGFEIPLYYMMFLMVFVTQGAGKFSLDNIFFHNENDNR
ncbi:DoxX family protein [Arcobacteraceae bacterium]|nr:DoxX family protein [Arcobacteraceae bacterium]